MESPDPARSSRPGPRLRRAVRPADRPAGPRAACVCADRPARHDGRAGPRAQPAGADPLGRPGERLRARCAALRPAALRPGRSGPGDLLRDATGLRGAGGHGPSRTRRASSAGPSAGSSTRTSPLFHGVPAPTTVWMSHGDQVHDAGRDFIPLAATATCPVAAVRHRDRPVYGLQFHPEVAHTPYGTLILGNFLDRICQSPRTWTMGAFIERVGRRDPARGSARPIGSSAGSRAASIRRSPRRCWPRRSGRGWSASSSTTACSARASGTRWPRRSAAIRRPSCGSSTPRSGSSTRSTG